MNLRNAFRICVVSVADHGIIGKTEGKKSICQKTLIIANANNADFKEDEE